MKKASFSLVQKFAKRQTDRKPDYSNPLLHLSRRGLTRSITKVIQDTCIWRKNVSHIMVFSIYSNHG